MTVATPDIAVIAKVGSVSIVGEKLFSEYPFLDTKINRTPEIFEKWCAKNKVFHYSKPKSDYSVQEALELAQAAECSYLFAEVA